MAYKIPDESILVEIIERVMRQEGIVDSQSLLLKEVRKHLNRMDPEYRVSAQRLRKIAIKMKNIRVEIRCKITDRSPDDMKTCPVCGEDMERIENMTLDGKKITVGYRCTFCPYWTGMRLRVPIRYIFRSTLQ